MSSRRQLRTAAAWLLAAVLVFACMGAAHAAAGDESEAKFFVMVGDDPSVVDVDIINFKARLNELGFYRAGVTDDMLQNKELDPLTMAAVKEVCRLNPEFTYYEDGVTYALFWRVMGETEGPLVTPDRGEYETIPQGAGGDAVTQVQNRLNQLGYDAVGGEFTPGVYDSAVQKAVDAFVSRNKLVYEKQDGITAELQKALFSDDALSYVATGLFVRVTDFIKGSSGMFGVNVPNVVFVLAGFVLICVIVVLAFWLAGRKKPAEEGAVRFTVEYEGERFTYSSDGKSRVRIGRGVGKFPLNMDDSSISREHCEIVPEGGGMTLRDTSSFGTKVNGVMCHHDGRALHSGDMLEVGKHRITIQF